MIKKIIIVSVIVLGVGVLVAGPGIFSHMGHVFHKARSGIQAALPLEYEIERAESMIEKITPEIEEGQKIMAQEQVETRYLEAAIARLEARQASDAERLKARGKMLKTERVSYTIAGRKFARETLESELRLAFQRFKQNQENLAAKYKLLEARRGSLSAARANLAKAANDRDTLYTRVEHLKARLREEQALEAASASYEVDSSTLADVKGILDRCQKRLDVLRQVRENREGATITLSEEDLLPTGNVIQEVEKYFSGDSGSATSTSAAVLDNDCILATTCSAGK